MDKGLKMLGWILKQEEFNKEDFVNKFRLTKKECKNILKFLKENKIIIEPYDNNFMVRDTAKIFQNRIKKKLIEKLRKLITSENIKSEVEIKSWDDIEDIQKFMIYDGSEKIYEIHINNKIIKLEGKEILDYNIFRLRFFEEFGVLLETYRGINIDWARLVTHWNQEYGEVVVGKSEILDDTEEAKELIIDYVNNITPTDNHVLKEGLAYVKDGCIYIATRIVKKLLKRNNLNVSIRKLAYKLKDYLLSGSIPIKIENKSERFWKFDIRKFDISNKDKLKIVEDEDG